MRCPREILWMHFLPFFIAASQNSPIRILRSIYLLECFLYFLKSRRHSIAKHIIHNITFISDSVCSYFSLLLFELTDFFIAAKKLVILAATEVLCDSFLLSVVLLVSLWFSSSSAQAPSLESFVSALVEWFSALSVSLLHVEVQFIVNSW